MFPRKLLLTLPILLAGCQMGSPEYIGGTTAAGALLGYAVTGDDEGAVRGAALGAVYGLANSYQQSGNVYHRDGCSRYRHNQGAYAACKRGQERRAREHQRKLERRAYRSGRGY